MCSVNTDSQGSFLHHLQMLTCVLPMPSSSSLVTSACRSNSAWATRSSCSACRRIWTGQERSFKHAQIPRSECPHVEVLTLSASSLSSWAISMNRKKQSPTILTPTWKDVDAIKDLEALTVLQTKKEKPRGAESKYLVIKSLLPWQFLT